MNNNPSVFDNSIRREGQNALHAELLHRLGQHGVTLDPYNATDSTLADLLSAIEGFERAVVAVGGDLFVDSPDSSEPERQEFVIPRPTADDTLERYIKRVAEAANRVYSSQ
jgi:hypothetical protein